MKIILLALLTIIPSLVCNSQTQSISFVINGGIQDKVLKQKIESNTKKLLVKINEAFKNSSESLQFDDKIITENGLKMVSDLWGEGHFYCSADKISENLLQKSNFYQVRNIPFVFGKTDNFDVVLEYLPDGRISDLYIGLEAHQYRSILSETNSVIDQTRREIILNFLENLRTSYVKKDINYIEKLYSDKALIIIGKVLKPDTIPNDQFKKNFTKNQAEFQVLTKVEYISRLQKVFSSISYLRLDFKNIEVVKHRKYPNFYGIKLEQTWNTPNYKDDGLLFLLVQFKENEDPIIWVRTWQDALKTPAGDEFGIHNFTFSSGDKVNN